MTTSLRDKKWGRLSKRTRAGIVYYLPATIVTGLIIFKYPSVGTGVLFLFALLGLFANLSDVFVSDKGEAEDKNHVRKAKEINVPLLGKMHYDDETDYWVTSLGGMTICLSGDGKQPYPILVESALWFRSNHQQFEKDVASFLKEQQKAFQNESELLAEMNGLKMDAVMLSMMDKPYDGMIYFKGEIDTGRVWRCDMVNKSPTALGFDD